MKLIQTKSLVDLNDLRVFVDELASLLPQESVVLLAGHLGAGKTTLVAYFCKKNKIHVVQSPTYSIHHRYQNENTIIDHFDLYRLETEDEIQAAGFYDLLVQYSDYKFIEWAERVSLDSFEFLKHLYKLEILIEPKSSKRVVNLYQIN